MPDRQSYDEAMLFARARLKVPDLDIKQGTVEKYQAQTTRGTFAKPWGMEGGFAVVYKFRTQSGQLKALRCFRVPMDSDTQYRYEKLGPYFRSHIPDITVDFTYYEQGILVDEEIQGVKQKRIFPVIVMDWVEGMTLLEKLDGLCKRGDNVALHDIAEQWVSILQKMRFAQIAHGDLAAQNVMVRSDGRLVLVDYDGVYIPDFAHLRPVVAGQTAYQHKDLQSRPFNEYMDDFSAMVIYLSLLALQAQPTLWKKYVRPNTQAQLDGNLLFRREDLVNPDASAIFADLAQMGDRRIQELTRFLRLACNAPVQTIRLPETIIDPDIQAKQMLQRLEAAIQSDNDEEIVRLWVPPLDHYADAQRHQQRVMQAKAWHALRAALQSRSLRRVAEAYQPLLEQSGRLTHDECEMLRLACAFWQAYQQNDDKCLADVYMELQHSPYAGRLMLTPQEQQRAQQALERKEALATLRAALANKLLNPIVATYTSELEECQLLTPDELAQVKLAKAFVLADYRNDDSALVAAYDAISISPYCTMLQLTAQEQQRVERARWRVEALAVYKTAQASKRITQIASAAQELEQNGLLMALTAAERESLQLVYELVQAYQNEDDEALVTTWQHIQEAGFQAALELLPQEEQRLQLAQQRKTALTHFRLTCNRSQKAHDIVQAYSPLLDDSANLTRQERMRLDAARRFIVMWQAVVDALQANRDDDAIMAVYDEELAMQFSDFTEEQRSRLALVLLHKKMKQALAAKAYGLVLQTAQVIERQTRMPLESVDVSLARRRFIHQYEPRNLQVLLSGDMAIARWDWPNDELVQYAVLVWRSDRWPLHPQKPDPGRAYHRINRQSYQAHGYFQFSYGNQRMLYVQVYFAISDYVSYKDDFDWFYSSGKEETSRQAVVIPA